MSSPDEVIGFYFDYVLPFWISIALLSLCQGLVVALPRALVARVAGSACAAACWALIPRALGDRVRGSLRALPNAAAPQALTYLALVRRARCSRRSRSAG